MRRQKSGDDLLKSLPVGGVGTGGSRGREKDENVRDMNDGSRGVQGLGLSGVNPVSPPSVPGTGQGAEPAVWGLLPRSSGERVGRGGRRG